MSETMETTEVGPEPVQRPRLWPTMIVIFCGLPAAVLFSGIIVVVVLAVTQGVDTLTEPGAIEEQIAELLTTPMGVVLLLVPGQLLFLALGVGPALFSRVPLARRLGFVKPHIPVKAWVFFVLALPAVQITNLLTLQSFDEPSPHVEQLYTMFHDSPIDAFVLVLLLYSIVPGIVEELLFRGYIQTRLLERWHAGWAILLCATLFAFVHGDPMHMIAVFPLGIWFGVIAWKARSVWPAVAVHFVNNVYGIVTARFTEYDPEDPMAMNWDAPSIVILSLSALSLAWSIRILMRVPDPEGPERVFT